MTYDPDIDSLFLELALKVGCKGWLYMLAVKVESLSLAISGGSCKKYIYRIYFKPRTHK